MKKLSRKLDLICVEFDPGTFVIKRLNLVDSVVFVVVKHLEKS